MDQRVAYHNGVWGPQGDANLALDDWGFVQGATLVERLRTVNGTPLDAAAHLERLRKNAGLLGIEWPAELDQRLIDQTIERNSAAHSAPDIAVVILLTPGRASRGPAGKHPTLILHTGDLHWSALAHWYRHGQALVTASNRNVPAVCWSTHLKTRSRLHYFLADQQAAASGLPHAGAAMLSVDDHLTESSVANLLVVDKTGLVSPPIDSVLHGVSLQRTLRLAERVRVPVRFAHITREAARAARGIILTGSSGCVWPASQLDDVRFQDPVHEATYALLRDAWIEDIGLDYVSQAVQTAAA